MNAIRRLRDEIASWFRPIPTKVFSVETSLLEIEGFAPAGFSVGVAILNDDKTPMEFVVSVLEDQFGMDHGLAVATMLQIHEKGGVLLPLATREQAESVAQSTTALAREHAHPLVCRVEIAQQRAAGDVRNARA